ncbi:hypothetical protein FC679_20245 [Bacillus cereus]|uniref:hypothetical protein n=1 Tax=Bacillus cereus TaxID=1396 RepID=UPI0010BDCCB0|nr:hypothetical protein [Bacillus cereus]MCU4776506.1 hypothetical protein [Bacillus cereus]MCU4804891.1 hypothetical protein [Bacillus cereus]MCU5141936.1 hypothetical protein [Bacillus cereus]TKH59935.1 hypothetical protein FC679_20245 [Bacillus cereus]
MVKEKTDAFMIITGIFTLLLYILNNNYIEQKIKEPIVSEKTLTIKQLEDRKYSNELVVYFYNQRTYKKLVLKAAMDTKVDLYSMDLNRELVTQLNIKGSIAIIHYHKGEEIKRIESVS